jgi:hypothetical protein
MAALGTVDEAEGKRLLMNVCKDHKILQHDNLKARINIITSEWKKGQKARAWERRCQKWRAARNCIGSRTDRRKAHRYSQL